MGRPRKNPEAETEVTVAPARPRTALEVAQAGAKYEIWLFAAHDKFAARARAKAADFGLDPATAYGKHINVLEQVLECSEFVADEPVDADAVEAAEDAEVAGE